ncbi:uncharacterized protein KZ484_025067 [Pholidichthys leucotaenia]
MRSRLHHSVSSHWVECEQDRKLTILSRTPAEETDGCTTVLSLLWIRIQRTESVPLNLCGGTMRSRPKVKGQSSTLDLDLDPAVSPSGVTGPRTAFYSSAVTMMIQPKGSISREQTLLDLNLDPAVSP